MKFITIHILLCFTLIATAQQPAHYLSQGNKLYKKQDYAGAVQQYDRAINSDLKFVALLNKGNALYRQKKYEDAIKAYAVVAKNKKATDQMRSGAYYNTGVAYSYQDKIKESIEPYKQALRLNWKDQDARENLQKALLELKKQSGGGGGGGDDQDKNQDQSKSDMSKNQAQQQLQKLEQKERNTQQKMSQKQSQNSGSAGKDW